MGFKQNTGIISSGLDHPRSNTINISAVVTNKGHSTNWVLTIVVICQRQCWHFGVISFVKYFD